MVIGKHFIIAVLLVAEVAAWRDSVSDSVSGSLNGHRKLRRKECFGILVDTCDMNTQPTVEDIESDGKDVGIIGSGFSDKPCSAYFAPAMTTDGWVQCGPGTFGTGCGYYSFGGGAVQECSCTPRYCGDSSEEVVCPEGTTQEDEVVPAPHRGSRQKIEKWCMKCPAGTAHAGEEPPAVAAGGGDVDPCNFVRHVSATQMLSTWNNYKTWGGAINDKAKAMTADKIIKPYDRVYDYGDVSNEILDTVVYSIACGCTKAGKIGLYRDTIREVEIGKLAKAKEKGLLQPGNVKYEILVGGPKGWFQAAGCYPANRGFCRPYPPSYTEELMQDSNGKNRCKNENVNYHGECYLVLH